jgi:hypothetical protein
MRDADGIVLDPATRRGTNSAQVSVNLFLGNILPKVTTT